MLKFSSAIFISPWPKRQLGNTPSDATCRIPGVKLFIKIGYLTVNKFRDCYFALSWCSGTLLGQNSVTSDEHEFMGR